MPDDIETPQRARDRAWYGDPTRRYECPTCHTSFMQLSRVIFDNGFGYGLRYAIKRGSMISPYITQFIELITYVFGREDYYAELYLASLGVHKTMGRDEQALRRMGEALAHINTGEAK